MERLGAALAVGLLTIASGAWADRLVPTERVQNRVIVRESPTSQSPDIGSLRPGESLDLRPLARESQRASSSSISSPLQLVHLLDQTTPLRAGRCRV